VFSCFLWWFFSFLNRLLMLFWCVLFGLLFVVGWWLCVCLPRKLFYCFVFAQCLCLRCVCFPCCSDRASFVWCCRAVVFFFFFFFLRWWFFLCGLFFFFCLARWCAVLGRFFFFFFWLCLFFVFFFCVFFFFVLVWAFWFFFFFFFLSNIFAQSPLSLFFASSPFPNVVRPHVRCSFSRASFFVFCLASYVLALDHKVSLPPSGSFKVLFSFQFSSLFFLFCVRMKRCCKVVHCAVPPPLPFPRLEVPPY